jgi:hypothetical protein
MKKHTPRTKRTNRPTLADLLYTITRMTHDERLSAAIVADMINSRQVRLEGRFHGRRVVVC